MATPPQTDRPNRGLLGSVNDFLRWLLFVALVSAGGAALVFYVIQLRLDDEIRRRVEQEFRSHYPGLRVDVQVARRVPGVGIEIRGLALAIPDKQRRKSEPLVYIDELLLRCSTELGDLVANGACSSQIIVRRMQITARQGEGGKWDVARLIPLPKFGKAAPEVLVEDGTVQLYSDSGRPLRLQIRALRLMASAASELASREAANASLRYFRSELSGDLFSAARLEGQVDLSTLGWSVQGGVEGLEAVPQALAMLPTALRQRVESISCFHGQAQVNFRAQGVGSDWSQCRYALAGVAQGRWEDARLPQPLSQVEARFHCDNRELQIERVTARAGQTNLEFSAELKDYLHGGVLVVRGSVERLLIDEQLTNSLPEEWQCVFQQIAPRGIVNARVRLAFDGQKWLQDVTLDCVDLSLSYCRFPYPINKLRGQVRYRDGLLDLVNVWASANGRPLSLEGQLLHPGPRCTGWFQFSVKEPIPLDEQLLSALQEPAQQIVRSLEPHGSVTVWGRYERPTNAPSQLHKRLEIGLVDGSINYERFRYPLYRIRGNLSMTDDCWTFRDLEGCNDSGWVTCSGSWQPIAAGGTALALDFNATDVPLEDELRDALKPQTQQIWNSLAPRGVIDQLRATVRYQSLTRELAVDIAAVKRPPAQNTEGRSITLKPSWLPYQWDNVVGSVHCNGDHVDLKNIRANHGDTTIDFSGDIETSPSGPWRIRLAPLSVDRIDATREMVMALPPRLGHALSRLNVSGLVSMSGSLEVNGSSDRTVVPMALWNLDVDLENGGIDCGTRFESIHGGVHSEGQFNGISVVSRGELNIDSLMCKGVQLTRISGPVQMEDADLSFGEWIPNPAQSRPPLPVTAVAWGGTLAGSGRVQLGEPAAFELDLSLSEGELAAISQEATLRKRNISGRAFANVLLSGSSEGTHTLRGRGHVLLRDANIYELPVMVRLIKLLSIKTPDQTAFTSSDVDFRIEADRVYFDRIDFDGDAISLDGRGEMSLDRQIRLTFGTIVGRDDYYATLVRPILKEAGRRLMVIEVSGTLDDPNVRREIMPQLSERFQQMFPNMTEPEAPRTGRVLHPREVFQPNISR